MPPAVSSLLSTPSSSQSVLLGREPPTDRDKGPRAATSLLAAEVKKLLGLVSAVAPGGERGQLNEVAAVQGQLRHLLRGDYLAERGIGCFDGDRLAGNCHGGDHGGGYEREVEFARFIHLETQILGFSALKTRRVHVHGVGSDREQGER